MQFIFLFCIIILSSGCAKLAHLDQLLTLKAFSDGQGATDAYIEKQDKKFRILLKAVQDKSIEHYPKKDMIVRKFGDPVYCEDINHKGEGVEFCLYRYAKRFFNSEKVYLYFDKKGKLLDWACIPLNILPSETNPALNTH